jgi:hypothetical protein
MLEAMAGLAGGRVTVELVEGRWPDVAGAAGDEDVTVSANVAYNVADLGPFLEALTASARYRVVLELTERHPQTSLALLWKHFWDLDRPPGPTAADAEAVVREVVGVTPRVRSWELLRSILGDGFPDAGWLRRRLCLPVEAEPQVADLASRSPDMARSAMVTLSWPGSARPTTREE